DLRGNGLGQQIVESAAQMMAHRKSGQVAEDLVDAHDAPVVVDECQSDGSVRQHRVEQGKRIVQSRSLLSQRSDHAIEGLNQVANFVMNADRKRKTAAVFR